MKDLVYPEQIESITVYEDEFYTKDRIELENFMITHGTRFFKLIFNNGEILTLEDIKW